MKVSIFNEELAESPQQQRQASTQEKVSILALNLHEEKEDPNEKVSTFALGLSEDHQLPPGTQMSQEEFRELADLFDQEHQERLSRRESQRQQRADRRAALVRQQNCEEQELEEQLQQPSCSNSATQQQQRFSRQQSSVSVSFSSNVSPMRRSALKPNTGLRSILKGAVSLQVPQSQAEDKPLKRSVKFSKVELFKFGWDQGVDTVPSMGIISLGMERRHHTKHTFNIRDYVVYREAEDHMKYANWRQASRLLWNMEMTRRGGDKRKWDETEAAATSGECSSSVQNQKNSKNSRGRHHASESPTPKRIKFRDTALESSESSTEAEEEEEEGQPAEDEQMEEAPEDEEEEVEEGEEKEDGTMEEQEEEEEEVEEEDEGESQEDDGTQLFDHSRVFEPLRRLLLVKSGVKIDESIANDTREVFNSRNICGCRCRGGRCLPKKCECALEGIKCQVDCRDAMDPANNFPCACTAAGCKNPEGRIELDVDRIQSHFQKTIIRENPSSITTKSHHQHQTRQSQQSTSESHCSSSQQEMQQHSNSNVNGSRNNKQNPQHKFFDSYLQFFNSIFLHFLFISSIPSPAM